MSYQSVKQECLTRVSNKKNVSLKYEVSSKTVPQECQIISVKQKGVESEPPDLPSEKAQMQQILEEVAFFCWNFLDCHTAQLTFGSQRSHYTFNTRQDSVIAMLTLSRRQRTQTTAVFTFSDRHISKATFSRRIHVTWS